MKKYRFVSAMLAVLMVLSMTLAGCGKKNGTDGTAGASKKKTATTAAPTKEEKKDEGTTAAEKKDAETTAAKKAENTGENFRLVTDQAGREVKVPLDPKRVIITFWPMGSAYTLFQGSADTIIGMDPNIVSAAKYSLLTRIDPKVADIRSDFMDNNGVINEETLIQMKPDLALIPAYAKDQLETCEKLKIPALVFDVVAKDFNTVETFMSWVDLLGKAFGKEGKATAIREYGEKTLKEIAERTKNLKDEDKPKVLLLTNYSKEGKATSGAKQFARFEIESTGGLHVGRDVAETFIQLNMEQIYKWNPDIIYLTTFSPYNPEDLYNNTAAPNDDWSKINAVKNKKVFKFPLGIFRWYPPSADSPLSLWWMAKNNQPELFKDIDLNQKIRDYYKNLYNIDLTEDDIKYIFTPKPEAAAP